jgi:hypothetical protein
MVIIITNNKIQAANFGIANSRLDIGKSIAVLSRPEIG